MAEHSDVVVLCLGLDETLEGEEMDGANSSMCGDKPDLYLPGPQRELLEAVCGCGRPVVLCLMSGSAIDLNYADSHANAVLQLWYPGARGGRAAADPVWKQLALRQAARHILPQSGRFPDFEDYSMKGRTYRYLEKEPLYPFGYGLTYGRT